MSNGRKWRRGRVGAAAAAGLGMVVAPMALVGTASALPVTPTAAVTNPVYVAPGSTSTTAPTFTVTLQAGSTYSQGDVIKFDITEPPLATNAGSVTFAGTPTVTTTAAAGTTAPQFSAVLSHNSANAGSTGTDEITLTETGPSITTGTTGAETIAVTGANVAAGSLAAAGPENVTSSYIPAPTGVVGTPIPITVTGNPFATVTNLAVSAGTPVAFGNTLTNTPLPNVTIGESIPGVLGTTVTVDLTSTSGGSTASVTSLGKPTVTSSNPAVTVTNVDYTTSPGRIVITLSQPTDSTTGPTTLTVGSLTANGTATVGNKIDATVTPTGGAVLSNSGKIALGADVVVSPAIAGPDAQTTAATLYGQSSLPNKYNTLVLATAQNFPDALSAAYLAGTDGAGIALVDTNDIPPATQSIITNMATNYFYSNVTIYVMGGTAAISDNVVTQIKSYFPTFAQPTVVRVAGADQFGTNQATLQTAGAPTTSANLTLPASPAKYNTTTGASSTSFPTTAARTAIVASGVNFPDALAASALSYKDKIPVVLTTPDTLSSTAASILQGYGIQQVIMVGGPVAVSDAVEGQIASGLNIPVFRVAGQDATSTSINLAHLENDANTGLTIGAVNYVARGDFYADALASSQYLATVGNSPLLLTETPTVVGPYLPAFLASQGALTNDTIQPFGGPVALTPATLNTLAADTAAGTAP